MKGKKSDTAFVAEFVCECAKQGIFSPNEIAEKAKNEIESIDNKLKKIIELKNKRSKLIDVLDSFKSPVKNLETERQYLSFFQIKDLRTAKQLCTNLDLVVESLPKDSIFIVKQLVSLKICKLEKNKLVPGICHNDFICFLKVNHIE